MKKLQNKTIEFDLLISELVDAINRSEFKKDALYEAKIYYSLALYLTSKTRKEKIDSFLKYVCCSLELLKSALDQDCGDVDYSITNVKKEVDVSKFKDVPKTFLKRWEAEICGGCMECNPFELLKKVYELLKNAENDSSKDMDLIFQLECLMCYMEGFCTSKVCKVAKKYQLEFERFYTAIPMDKKYGINLK